MGTIHSPSPLQYSLMGTSTSSALEMQLPRAMTNEVDSAPVSVCKDSQPWMQTRCEPVWRAQSVSASPPPPTHCASPAYLWKIGEVLNYAGTFLVEDSDGQDWHAGTQILEGQVEPSALGQRPETPDFCVHLHQPAPKVYLGETLIGGNSVHLRDRRRTGNGQELYFRGNFFHKQQDRTAIISGFSSEIIFTQSFIQDRRFPRCLESKQGLLRQFSFSDCFYYYY